MKNKITWAFAIAVGLFVYLSGSGSFEEFQDKTLSEFRQLATSERKDIAEEFASENDLPSDSVDGIYACLSQMVFTKSADLKLGEVAGWCKTDYENGQLGKYINFDNFENGFSKWDGAFSELETIVKDAMNDSDSYEHVQTRYRLVLDDNPKAIVTTQFKGKNGFGAIVKNQVSASVDIGTGKVKEIIQ
ncbi:hypothetical protein [Vibrio parahaemolyticus]|uniref:hypothetical protein n=1 Tax=Vibrio parahaemolyticus TaxID=670 RepID=UPI00301C7CC6